MKTETTSGWRQLAKREVRDTLTKQACTLRERRVPFTGNSKGTFCCREVKEEEGELLQYNYRDPGGD